LSNYIKATDFASKDALLSGNPAKIIKGTEIDTEFNNIATAVATKTDTNSPTLTGTPSAPTASPGTNSTQIATTAFVQAATTAERTATATLTNKTLTSPVINEIIHEGTADAFETTIAFTDPTADRTVTIPDSSGTIAFESQLPAGTNITSKSGTYAIAGTTMTVTVVGHGLLEEDFVYLSFTSGDAVSGEFEVVSVPDADTFTITYGSSLTTTGNVTGYYSNLGLIEIASLPEATVGTNNNKAVTPLVLNSIVDTKINAQKLTRETAQATTSGTSFDFTGIPSWVQRITVIFSSVSIDATDDLLIQVGDAGGIETTGYVSRSSEGGDNSTSTSGYVIRINSGSNIASGTLSIVNVSGNTWISSHVVDRGSSSTSVGAGSKTLSDVLTQVRLTTPLGSSFDAGSVNILYE